MIKMMIVAMIKMIRIKMKMIIFKMMIIIKITEKIDDNDENNKK